MTTVRLVRAVALRTLVADSQSASSARAHHMFVAACVRQLSCGALVVQDRASRLQEFGADATVAAASPSGKDCKAWITWGDRGMTPTTTSMQNAGVLVRNLSSDRHVALQVGSRRAASGSSQGQ